MKANEICYVETTTFHDEIGSESYPYEPGRYWLYTSKVCPFAHRTEIMRMLSGLSDHIGLTIAGSVQTAGGWNLDECYEGHESSRSPVGTAKRMPEIYEIAAPGYTGRASIPVLFDTKTNRIVNNESAEIIRQFDNIAMQFLDKETLYPENKRQLIDRLVDRLGNDLITPIYRAGFAVDQQSYLTYFYQVFSFLDTLDKNLGDSGPYIAGEQLTLADVHAYPHLVRFDAVYHSLYRLNMKFIRDYPHIADYMGRLGEISAFAGSLDIQASKLGYFLSWNQPTNGNFVPVGPAVHPCSGVAL
jgi:glutathionyl-hydroquinone reductase